jgi:hypothetical protein
MSEEERGFVVRDKRGRTDSSGDASSTLKQSESTSSSAAPGGQGDTHHQAPPVTFSSFVFSLGTSALMLMGETLDPNQPQPPVNLPQAKEIIDILSMLEGKTSGNLSTEEASVIRDMLYTLRMKFVSASQGSGKIASL